MHFKLYKNEVFARIVKRTLQYSVLEWSKKTIAFWTRNTFCRMGVCPMQLFHFWSRDVHPGQNLLLCTKFHENRMFFFTEIWRYINFQNGGRPPSWNCFTTIRDHPRSLCCWPQLPVKFHVNLIHRSEDIAIWIFRIFDLKCLFRPQNGSFRIPKCDYSSSRPTKGTSLRKSASFKLSTEKIRWGVWPVRELTESVTDTQTHTCKFIFRPCIALDRQLLDWHPVCVAVHIDKPLA